MVGRIIIKSILDLSWPAIIIIIKNYFYVRHGSHQLVSKKSPLLMFMVPVPMSVCLLTLTHGHFYYFWALILTGILSRLIVLCLMVVRSLHQKNQRLESP